MFQPVVPVSGIAGLAFIERTQEKQQAAFEQSPQLQREMEYFRENVFKATTAEALVADRTLLKVALGAFGLDDDIDKKYFLQRILEEGTEDQEALAMRLVDTRYREFSEAFGYGNLLGANVLNSDFSEQMLSQFKTRQFEIAVGQVDNSVRLAMNFKREIAKFLPETDEVDNAGTAWFRMMGNEPIRSVLEMAFGLPGEIGALDIDKQKELFEAKAASMHGSSSARIFEDPDTIEQVVRDFMARSQIQSGPTLATPGMAAVTLLNGGGGGFGASASTNLLLSLAR